MKYLFFTMVLFTTINSAAQSVEKNQERTVSAVIAETHSVKLINPNGYIEKTEAVRIVFSQSATAKVLVQWDDRWGLFFPFVRVSPFGYRLNGVNGEILILSTTIDSEELFSITTTIN